MWDYKKDAFSKVLRYIYNSIFAASFTNLNDSGKGDYIKKECLLI